MFNLDYSKFFVLREASFTIQAQVACDLKTALDTWLPEMTVKKYVEGMSQDLDYHNVVHVLSMLQCLEEVAPGFISVGRAILFHDYSYDPKMLPGKNEHVSSLIIKDWMLDNAYDADQARHVSRLVNDTAHYLQECDLICWGENTKLILDLDLWSLSFDRPNYETVTQCLRNENKHVSEETFNQNRLKFIEKILGRKSIYRTDLMRERFEEQARRNLQLDKQQLSPAPTFTWNQNWGQGGVVNLNDNMWPKDYGGWTCDTKETK